MSSALKVSIEKKFQLYDKYKKSKLEVDNLKYKTHMNKLTHLITKAKIKHYYDRSVIYGADKSKTWGLVNEISSRKRKSGCDIKKLIDSDGNVLESPQEIANCLNSHFGSVGAKMAKKFDELDSNLLKDPLSFIQKEKNYNSMIVFPTDEFEISRLISKLDNKKSSGYD